jgi:hypothetical protein
MGNHSALHVECAVLFICLAIYLSGRRRVLHLMPQSMLGLSGLLMPSPFRRTVWQSAHEHGYKMVYRVERASLQSK